MKLLLVDFLVRKDQALADAKGRIAGLPADLQNISTRGKLLWATALHRHEKHSALECFQ